jgi:non-heme chloroperoxidase
LLPLAGLARLILATGNAIGAQGRSGLHRAFSETDFTEDLKKIDVPTLIIHGDDDQIVPIADSAMLTAKLVKEATLKVYSGAPHGLCSTHKNQLNTNLLAFLRE